MDDILVWSRTVLQTTPERWEQLVESLPAELLRLQPAPGEWSALECLQHLIDTERHVFPVRVEHLLSGEDFPNFDPDAQGTRPDVRVGPQQLAQDLLALRGGSLALFDTLKDGDLDRRARHSELGMVSLRELLNEWAGHDLMHTVQAERALMQPFIDGCGPWRPYFADHVAAKTG